MARGCGEALAPDGAERRGRVARRQRRVPAGPGGRGGAVPALKISNPRAGSEDAEDRYGSGELGAAPSKNV